MIESFMYFGIGFLLAALSVLVVVPLVHGRAVRLTTRRLEDAIPSSMAEILAEKDLLRAEFAMSTRRLEMNVEQLKTKSASQLAELGRKGHAINRLKIELGTLRGQMRDAEEDFAIKATAVHEAQRALSDKESEMAKRMRELDERSTFADAQKIEIITIKTQVKALKEQLDGATNELKAVEDRRDAAVHEAQRALSEKESELAERMRELDEQSTLADAQKIEIISLKTKNEALEEQLKGAKAVKDCRDAAVHEAQRALSEKESEVAKRMHELDERSTLADVQKIEIITLKIKIGALEERLDGATNELKAVEDRRDAAVHEAQHALSEKESELAERMRELNERSTFANAQKIEIITLKTKNEALEEQLDGATNQLKAVEDCRATERIELKATTQKLIEERGEFENFHRRVAELVQQLMAQSTKDKNLSRRAQELEKRLVEQSRLLEENYLELKNLRGEIASVRKAEADLRGEIDARVNIATEDLKAEKAKLQAAFDRANGERMRLAYELVNIKRQVEETWAAERIDNPMLSDVAA